jgi:hypothetical protein
MALYHQVSIEFRSESYSFNELLCFIEGGLIEIQQNWNCNFDFAKQKKECFPSFTFNLLQSGSDELSPGINYR